MYEGLHIVQMCELVSMHVHRGLRQTQEVSLNTLHHNRRGSICRLNPEFAVLISLSRLCLLSARITGQLPHRLCVYVESGNSLSGSAWQVLYQAIVMSPGGKCL